MRSRMTAVRQKDSGSQVEAAKKQAIENKTASVFDTAEQSLQSVEGGKPSTKSSKKRGPVFAGVKERATEVWDCATLILLMFADYGIQ